MDIPSRSSGALLASAAMLLLSFTPVHAVNASESNPWSVDGALYFWYASVGGRTSAETGVDIDASDLVGNLDYAFMGNLDARKDKWSFMVDMIYLDIGADKQTTASIPGDPGVSAAINANVDLAGWVTTLTGAYNVLETDRNRVDILAGARYLWLKTDLDIGLGAPLPPATLSTSESGSVLDAIIGIKGRLGLSDKWFLPYYLDIGAGESKSTWQAFGGIGYQFSKVDAVLAYRHLEWEYDDRPVFNDLNFDGPFAGVKFRL